MSALFIVGNGFDIAQGIPSEYRKFREFLIRKYPEALEFRDEKIYLEDADEIEQEEFAAEILLSALDQVDGPDWEDFEASLAHVNFSKKLPGPELDGDETDEEDTFLMQQYLLYMDRLTSGFIACAKKYWQEFFQQWLRELQIPIKLDNFEKKDSLSRLFRRTDMKFFTFNYTKTLEKLYGINPVTHIHGTVGQNLIFGHGEKDIMYEPFSGEQENGIVIRSSFLDDMLQSFQKDTDFAQIRNKKFFRGLNTSIDQVYSYGFSYGKVDGVYIKRIIRKISSDAVWYFTEFESQDKESLRIKKVELRNYGFKGTFGVYEG